MKSSKVIKALLAGAAAGAILGILFAPDKGSATRKKIKEAGADLKESLKDKINEFVDEVASQYESAKEEAEEMMDSESEKTSDAKHSLS